MHDMNEIRPPSGYRIESALAAWQSARARLLAEDPALEHDEAALVDLLGPEEGDVNDVLARLVRGAMHAESMADAAAERIAAMREREARFKNRGQTMRATAFAVMDAIGLRKLELEDVTASVRSGQPSVQVTEIDLVPDIYVETVTTKKADKRTLLAVMKTGAAVPGCELSNAPPTIALRAR
jgi:hypothetical protein